MNPNIQLKPSLSPKPGEQYWHIHSGKNRVGHVAIKQSVNEALGEHSSIDIHINQRFRGRGIGSAAYKQASAKSGQQIVYAHMRKSNVASQKAASSAGYEVFPVEGDRQLTMKWQASE